MRVYQVAALFSAAGLLATASAGADDTGKARAEVQEQRKELNDKLKENTKELKEDQAEAKRELGEKKEKLDKEATEQRKELNEALTKLRETRLERRKELRDGLRTRHGELLKSPAMREELKTHAWRIARLNQIKLVADDQDKDKLKDRADKLIERENIRHEKQLEALKLSGAQGAAAAADPTAAGARAAANANANANAKLGANPGVGVPGADNAGRQNAANANEKKSADKGGMQ